MNSKQQNNSNPADFFVHFEEVKPIKFEFTLAEFHFGRVPKVYTTEQLYVITRQKRTDYPAGAKFPIYEHGFDAFRHLYNKGLLTTTRPPNQLEKLLDRFMNLIFKHEN